MLVVYLFSPSGTDAVITSRFDKTQPAVER